MPFWTAIKSNKPERGLKSSLLRRSCECRLGDNGEENREVYMNNSGSKRSPLPRFTVPSYRGGSIEKTAREWIRVCVNPDTNFAIALFCQCLCLMRSMATQLTVLDQTAKAHAKPWQSWCAGQPGHPTRCNCGEAGQPTQIRCATPR